jgi:hypothetical protein
MEEERVHISALPHAWQTQEVAFLRIAFGTEGVYLQKSAEPVAGIAWLTAFFLDNRILSQLEVFQLPSWYDPTGLAGLEVETDPTTPFPWDALGPIFVRAKAWRGEGEARNVFGAMLPSLHEAAVLVMRVRDGEWSEEELRRELNETLQIEPLQNGSDYLQERS